MFTRKCLKSVNICFIAAKKKKTAAGGEVYVLLIKNVKPDDTDVYVCEVNSDPMLRSFHPLRVKSKSIKSTDNDTSSEATNGTMYNEDAMPTVTHDFNECCDALNVSTKCKGFCSIHNIIDGSTGVEPETCESDFPNIVKCMADGRNHVPCCERKKIPDICQVSSRRFGSNYGSFQKMLANLICVCILMKTTFKAIFKRWEKLKLNSI